MNELKKGINDLAHTDSDFINEIGDRFSYVEDNSGELIFPYVVFSFQPFRKSRDSKTKYIEVVLQFTIYDDSASSENIGNLTKMLTSIFDDSENKLIVENYFTVSCVQIFTNEFKSDFWTSVIQYKIKLQLK